MFGPVFFKETLKIRWPWLTLAALNILLMVYIHIETRHLFVMDHAEIVWYQIMHLGQIHYGHLKYAPLVTGLLLAGVQYLPEMTGERLRLSLHLPVSPHRLILAHILVGLIAVGVIVVIDLAALAWISSRYFPLETVFNALLTALPWGLAGIASYLGVTLGFLEPSYRLKVFNLVVSAGVVGLFLFPAEPGGYRNALFYSVLPVAIMVPSVLLPAYRFRYRRAT